METRSIYSLKHTHTHTHTQTHTHTHTHTDTHIHTHILWQRVSNDQTECLNPPVIKNFLTTYKLIMTKTTYLKPNAYVLDNAIKGRKIGEPTDLCNVSDRGSCGGDGGDVDALVGTAVQPTPLCRVV